MNIIKCHPLIGEHVTKQPLVAGMRTVKKETLKLLSCWVSKCQDTAMVSDSVYDSIILSCMSLGTRSLSTTSIGCHSH